MRVIIPDPALVAGAIGERIARVYLGAGAWFIDMIIGCPGTVASAQVIVRPINGETLATFASAEEPNRVPVQRIILVNRTEIEFVMLCSSNRLGIAQADEIRVYPASNQQGF